MKRPEPPFKAGDTIKLYNHLGDYQGQDVVVKTEYDKEGNLWAGVRMEEHNHVLHWIPQSRIRS